MGEMMRRWKYPLATSTWGEEEVEAGRRVLESGRMTMGEKVEKFEAEFARTVGSKNAVFCNSGSSANLLAVVSQFYVKDSPLRPGDEVLVPAVAWATTYSPLWQTGLRIKLVDIDPETLNVSIDNLNELQNCQGPVRPLFAVNLLGNSCPWEDVFWECEDKLILEDNCESLGAVCESDCPCGSHGKVGTFSTFFAHHIQTGEGGVAITDDDETADIMRCLRSHGWSRALRNNCLGDSWHERFRFLLPGWNLRPTELAATIGLEQLRKLPRIIKMRRVNAATFRALLADLNRDERLAAGQREVGKSSWYAFALTLQGRLAGRRDELVARLEEVGVETRPVMSGNIARQPVAGKIGCAELIPGARPLPNADYLHHNGFVIGNSDKDLTEGLELAFQTMKEFSCT